MNDILDYYHAGKEADRLQDPWGRLEFERTCRLLLESLPPAPAQIADIGGGPGTYAAWLAERGYQVQLVDLMPEHVDEARRRLAGYGGCQARVGDACKLPLAEQSCDAVLLMGPLYHLLETEERGQALAEALRVLRPGGLLFATAISRFAYLLKGLWTRFFDEPDFVELVQSELEDGRHLNPPGRTWFTSAYFHRAEELQTEVRAAGFVQAEVAGIEGPAWLMPNLAEVQQRDFAWPLLDILAAIQHEPEMKGISTHLLVTGFKPVREPC